MNEEVLDKEKDEDEYNKACQVWIEASYDFKYESQVLNKIKECLSKFENYLDSSGFKVKYRIHERESENLGSIVGNHGEPPTDEKLAKAALGCIQIKDELSGEAPNSDESLISEQEKYIEDLNFDWDNGPVGRRIKELYSEIREAKKRAENFWSQLQESRIINEALVDSIRKMKNEEMPDWD